MEKLKTKKTTRLVMLIAKAVFAVWKFFRCKIRGVNNFDYYIYDLRSEYPSELVYQQEVAGKPFIQKVLEDDDRDEKVWSLFIGDCVIQYSFIKYEKASSLKIPTFLFREEQESKLKELLLPTYLSHNNPSFKLKTRKEKDNVIELHNL